MYVNVVTPCTRLSFREGCKKKQKEQQKRTKAMKTNPSLVHLHLQFQATFAEGADLLIPACSQRAEGGWAGP